MRQDTYKEFATRVKDHRLGWGKRVIDEDRTDNNREIGHAIAVLDVSPRKQHWLNKCKAAHGDRYDYSRVKYKAQRYDVEIICRTHGSFWQNAAGHVHLKRGCPECGVDRGAESKIILTEEFYHDAGLLHNNRWIYNGEFNGPYEPLTFTCREHGLCRIARAEKHLDNKQGCHECALRERKEKYASGEFVCRVG